MYLVSQNAKDKISYALSFPALTRQSAVKAKAENNVNDCLCLGLEPIMKFKYIIL